MVNLNPDLRAVGNVLVVMLIYCGQVDLDGGSSGASVPVSQRYSLLLRFATISAVSRTFARAG